MKEANVTGLRVQSTPAEIQKVCDQILDLLELNQIPPLMAVLGMWNVMILTFAIKFDYSYEYFEKTILNMLEESKSTFKHD